MNFRSATMAMIVFIACAIPGASCANAKDIYSPAQRDALAAVVALFTAMGKHDVDASRRLILPGANFVVLLPDGTVRIEPDTGYLDTLGKHREIFLERIWNAQVTVNGNIAQVWAPYDFHLDGKLSHCGIDNFSLVRTAAGWRVAGISYTVQKTGCMASPLGEVH
ncbi:nuclear transport factor 2 family protein [Rhodanobacter sp. AS-Z3]|uniref:nuclear transport factor 2 family protein n=1 Tax=Rhodanobacter sp. AS-Z3 TaxID=3031330 RepID=UPI00247A6D09|nr:nuclear transport factor 2 family protein [Rhodanobacter sp. AS-Z3]WEN14203.1 nuclear transport factor 2 family protein [Rhodanobacter sp. AS-Z3]